MVSSFLLIAALVVGALVDEAIAAATTAVGFLDLVGRVDAAVATTGAFGLGFSIFL